MIEKYRRQIQELDDLVEISNLLMEDKLFRKNLAKYIDSPYDSEIEKAGKGAFTLGISKAEDAAPDNHDPETAIVTATNEALVRLSCTGARYLTVSTPDNGRIHALGQFKSEDYITSLAFAKKGDTIYLLGETDEENDCQADPKVLDTLVKSIEKGLVSSAHAISRNGLFVSLIESCAPNKLGFDITGDAEIEDKEFLFGRSRYMALVTVTEKQENGLVDYLFNYNIPITLLGHVTKGELRLDELSFGYINDFIRE